MAEGKPENFFKERARHLGEHKALEVFLPMRDPHALVGVEQQQFGVDVHAAIATSVRLIGNVSETLYRPRDVTFDARLELLF